MTRQHKWIGGLLLAASVGLAGARPAAAQDIEVPIFVVDDSGSEEEESDDELDLANLVTGAAKTVTTVQEAPAIITIIPGDEFRERQARNLEDIIDLVPGFLRYSAFNGQFPQAVVRGVMQATLTLQDGFSTFDIWANAMTVHRGVPIELIKRVETISGPGGVLWGANSFMGVLNVITKDAEDIDGVEAYADFADGDGDRMSYKAYVMAGIPELAGRPDWGLVLHASYESYQGAVWNRPAHMFSTPLPNPNGFFVYGPSQFSDQPRSTIVQFNGKVTLGKFTLQANIPYMERYMAYGFNGPPSYQSLPEDSLATCSELPLYDPQLTMNENNPMTPANEDCHDRARASRNINNNFYERKIFGEYKTRFSDTAGLSVKVFGLQFVRSLEPLTILLPVPGLLEGGLAFDTNPSAYRVGTSIDGDVELGSKLRLLYGLEAFHEWIPDNTTKSRQGPGVETTFRSPYDVSRLPFACPLVGGMFDPMDGGVVGATADPSCPLTFIFEVSRQTVGGFGSLQFRPSKKLILDAGVRLQAAPELFATSLGYGLTPTLGAAAVYEFVPDWHVKLNYAEGFRPPVFNNTNSNGEAVQIDGSPELLVETSRSTQVEVNARLLKGRKRIRELNLRFDYSYTTLDNFIAFIAGRYANVGRRGIHSAEFLAKLYVKGGHRLELGYTANYLNMDDKGAFHSIPNHWFNVSSVNPLSSTFDVATVVKVYGAFEDPNRRVETRGLARDPDNGEANLGNPSQTVAVYPTEMVFDRAPPSAELQIGFRWRPGMFEDKLQLQGTLYNALGNLRNGYDNSNDLEPRLEIVPAQFEAFRFYVSGTYVF